MKHFFRCSLVAGSALLLATGCKTNDSQPVKESAPTVSLTGAWRSKIHFNDGVMAGVPDLEFSYAYNAGGTMTESSNYDEAPNSSPPAYGVWRQVAPDHFETKYVFYRTRAPVAADGPGTVGTWFPDGHGVITETIKLSADGASYTSTIKFDAFDIKGQPALGGGTGTGAGLRITF